MWIVMTPQRWDSFESTLRILPIKIDPGRMAYYLPVYNSLDDAKSEYPEGPFQQVEFIIKEDP